MFLHVSVILFTGGRGGIPAYLAGLQAFTGGSGVEGSGLGGGSPGPHPRGKLRGLAWGDLQAHTRGGGIPVSTEANPPPHTHTATAAGGTHPTGMLSCSNLRILK